MPRQFCGSHHSPTCPIETQPVPSASLTNAKAVRILGMDGTQLRRVKAVHVLGFSDFDIDVTEPWALALQLDIYEPLRHVQQSMCCDGQEHKEAQREEECLPLDGLLAELLSGSAVRLRLTASGPDRSIDLRVVRSGLGVRLDVEVEAPAQAATRAATRPPSSKSPKRALKSPVQAAERVELAQRRSSRPVGHGAECSYSLLRKHGEEYSFQCRCKSAARGGGADRAGIEGRSIACLRLRTVEH